MRSDKRKENWPDEDIRNYHYIKDDYFRSKGIELLHISENEWINNSSQSLQKILDLLKGVKNG